MVALYFMAMKAAQPENAPSGINPDAPHFSALLTPYRSLSPGGFAVLMAVAAGAIVIPALLFVTIGAWPIAGFLGLDILALWLAFKLNYRAAKAREEISVSRTHLVIRKVAPSGRAVEHDFNPFWAKLNVARHPEIGVTAMQVAGEGRSVGVGAFLNPDDRESFATAFSGALAAARR
jgi:uncharacterized membrane protein